MKWRFLAAIAAVSVLLLTVALLTGSSTATSTSAPRSSGCEDPRGPMFCASWTGTELGAPDLNGGAPIGDSVVNAEAGDLKPSVIRYEMWTQPCALATADPSDCTTTSEFNKVVRGIRDRDLSAQPLVVLPPIVNTCVTGPGVMPCDDQCSEGACDDQCQNGPSNQRWSLTWDEWIVRYAIADGAKLFELGNEPDGYCGMTSAAYYSMWAAVVPALRQYVRQDLHDAPFYIGGPAWANSDKSDLVDMAAFLTDTLQGYVAHGYDMDYVPDFISTHTYLSAAQDSSEESAQAAINDWGSFYTDLESVISGTYAGYDDDGYPISDMIKVVDSEYNDTVNTGSPINQSRGWCDFYFQAMFTMARQSKLWGWVQFSLAAKGNGALNLINPANGAEQPCYDAYQAQVRGGS
jgi:hypothetical protein